MRKIILFDLRTLDGFFCWLFVDFSTMADTKYLDSFVADKENNSELPTLNLRAPLTSKSCNFKEFAIGSTMSFVSIAAFICFLTTLSSLESSLREFFEYFSK